MTPSAYHKVVSHALFHNLPHSRQNQERDNLWNSACETIA